MDHPVFGVNSSKNGYGAKIKVFWYFIHYADSDAKAK